VTTVITPRAVIFSSNLLGLLGNSIAVSKSILRVHSVSQRPNLGHLGEPIGGAESLLEAVCFKKKTEGTDRGRVANARWE